MATVTTYTCDICGKQASTLIGAGMIGDAGMLSVRFLIELHGKSAQRPDYCPACYAEMLARVRAEAERWRAEKAKAR